MKRSMEALIHHFKLYSEGFHVPAGEVYVATGNSEASRRLSDRRRHQQPYKCKIRPPAFVHLSATEMLIAWAHAGGLTAVISSIDVVFGEVDR